MFGKSKKFAKQWKLEVRSRSKPLQALRLRMAASALAISAGVVMVLFVSWKGGEFLLDRYVYTNPALGVRRVSVTTDGIIPVAQIRAWTGVKEGQNLLSLDLVRIKRDLELVPLIETAAVDRILPNELVVRIREREPIARVHLFAPNQVNGLLERSSIFLDHQGMVIPAFVRELNSKAFDEVARHLPIITGADAAAFRPGHIIASPQILGALKWIRSFRNSSMVGEVTIESMDVSSSTALLVVTDRSNEISFAYDDFDRQIVRWQRIHQFGRRQDQVIASLDLVVTNYVPAVWAQITNNAPVTIRASEPSPYRRKNV